MKIATDMLGSEFAMMQNGIAIKLSFVACTLCAKVSSYGWRPMPSLRLDVTTDVHVRIRT